MTTPRTRTPKRTAGPARALGYVRVSTGQQVESGAGLDAQRATLEAEAQRRGWTLEIATDAGLTGKNMRLSLIHISEPTRPY